jgi:hypothetical protein
MPAFFSPRYQVENAGDGNVVEVTLGSSSNISVFPSDAILRPVGADSKPLSSSARTRIQWSALAPFFLSLWIVYVSLTMLQVQRCRVQPRGGGEIRQEVRGSNELSVA